MDIDEELTQKGYSNFRILVYGIFKLAKKKRLIDWSITNTISDIEISKSTFREIEHTDEELVFTHEEMPKIMKAIEEFGYDITNLALMLLFKTGCRPGEITAITRDNISVDAIRIDKSEVEVHDKSGTHFEVVSRTKTKAGMRTVPLPTGSAWIVKRILLINPNGEYVFEKKGERINQRHLRERLKILCKRAGVVTKSPNKIRKTYASELIDQGVETAVITKVMGHTDIATTEKFYHKNRYSDEEIAVRIRAVSL